MCIRDRNNTKALYVESLGNPNCDIVDMEALAEVALSLIPI